MAVGRDHIASTVYTLAFAYVGTALPMLMAASLMQRAAVMIVYLVMGLAFAWPVWRRSTRGKKEELPHE